MLSNSEIPSNTGKNTDSLDGFIEHLEQTFTHPKTRRDKLRYVNAYLNWLKAHQLTLEEVTYNNLLDFTGHLQDQGKAAYQRNNYIRAIEDYCSFKKISFGHKALRIRTHQKTLKPLLESKDLEAVYENYEPTNALDQLMLSLVIWQALEYEDLKRIEIQDAQLTKGRLYIKSRKGRNARYLPLVLHQVMQLHTYIEETKTNREVQQTNCLLITVSKTTLYTIWKQLGSQVKQQALAKQDQKISDLRQLRQSRLAIWVREAGLRQAQYKSGYTTVKGVERYRTQSTKALQDQLELYHPLG
jgi:hypothetical protein